MTQTWKSISDRALQMIAGDDLDEAAGILIMDICKLAHSERTHPAAVDMVPLAEEKPAWVRTDEPGGHAAFLAKDESHAELARRLFKRRDDALTSAQARIARLDGEARTFLQCYHEMAARRDEAERIGELAMTVGLARCEWLEKELEAAYARAEKAERELDAAWKETGVEGAVRGMVELWDVVRGLKENRDDARADLERMEERLDAQRRETMKGAAECAKLAAHLERVTKERDTARACVMALEAERGDNNWCKCDEFERYVEQADDKIIAMQRELRAANVGNQRLRKELDGAAKLARDWEESSTAYAEMRDAIRAELERVKRQLDECIAANQRTWEADQKELVSLKGELARLQTVIRTGGAMYRAERARMGIPGGHDPEQEEPQSRAVPLVDVADDDDGDSKVICIAGKGFLWFDANCEAESNRAYSGARALKDILSELWPAATTPLMREVPTDENPDGTLKKISDVGCSPLRGLANKTPTRAEALAWAKEGATDESVLAWRPMDLDSAEKRALKWADEWEIDMPEHALFALAGILLEVAAPRQHVVEVRDERYVYVDNTMVDGCEAAFIAQGLAARLRTALEAGCIGVAKSEAKT